MCAHNCLGAVELMQKAHLADENFITVGALNIHFPVKSMRRIQGDWLKQGEGCCSCNIVFCSLNSQWLLLHPSEHFFVLDWRVHFVV